MPNESDSAKDNVNGTISTIFKTKVVPAVEKIFGKMGINLEKIEDEKNIAQFKEKNIESHLEENPKQKSANIEQGIEKAIENVEKTMSTISDSGTKSQKQNENVKENTSLDKKKEEPISKSINSELNTEPDKMNTLSDENQSTDSDVNEQKPIGSKRKFSLKSLTTGLLESKRKNSKNKISNNDVKDEIQIDPSNLFQFVNPSVVSKTSEAKETFSNAGKEDGGNKIQKDESNVERDGDDSVEYIEEIVYIDGADGGNEEEIIEEIIETTTTQESPDSFDSQSDEPAPVVTVTKTTRKISSSSKPGEVVTTEETVISDNQENEGKKRKKSFGLKLGIGKSGVNASVGEKQMSVGLSGLKFGKKLDKSNGSDLISVGLDKSGLTLDRDLQPETLSDASSVSGRSTESSPKKSKIKAGISNFNLFKRSTSVPIGPDLPEDLGENPQSTATLPRKTSQGSAGLLVFGKSRSKSTGVLEADDLTEIVTDLNVLSDFIDQEREANLQQLNSSSVDSDKISPVQIPEQNLVGAVMSATENSKAKKIGDQLKPFKKEKNKSANGEKKSTKKSKK